MMGEKKEDSGGEYINDFKVHFRGNPEFTAKYLFMIDGKEQPLFLNVNGDTVDCKYGKEDNIVAGRETFQRAFSVGDMTAKGNFRTLRMLDEIFTFSK